MPLFMDADLGYEFEIKVDPFAWWTPPMRPQPRRSTARPTDWSPTTSPR
jgi:hypothetical protein